MGKRIQPNQPSPGYRSGSELSVLEAARTLRLKTQGGSYHSFGFYNLSRSDPKRAPSVHWLRDGHVLSELGDSLRDRGYRYGGVVLNYPTVTGACPLQFDLSTFDAAKMIVVTTRPPLDDSTDGSRKPPPPRSYSNLETAIFSALRKYFARCSRMQVILADELVAQCPSAVAERHNIEFRLYKNAAYYKHTNGNGCHGWHKPANPRTTAAYLICEPEIWPGGPALLCAFAMSGTDTLAWAHLLRTRFSGLVGVPGFVMAEIQTTPPPAQPYDLSFVDEWQVEILTGLKKPVWVDNPSQQPLAGAGG